MKKTLDLHELYLCEKAKRAVEELLIVLGPMPSAVVISGVRIPKRPAAAGFARTSKAGKAFLKAMAEFTASPVCSLCRCQSAELTAMPEGQLVCPKCLADCRCDVAEVSTEVRP